MPLIASSYTIVATCRLLAMGGACLSSKIKSNLSHQLHSLYEILEDRLERQDNINLYKMQNILFPTMLAVVPAIYAACGMYYKAAAFTTALATTVMMPSSIIMPTKLKDLAGAFIEMSGLIDIYRPGGAEL